MFKTKRTSFLDLNKWSQVDTCKNREFALKMPIHTNACFLFIGMSRNWRGWRCECDAAHKQPHSDRFHPGTRLLPDSRSGRFSYCTFYCFRYVVCLISFFPFIFYLTGQLHIGCISNHGPLCIPSFHIKRKVEPSLVIIYLKKSGRNFHFCWG